MKEQEKAPDGADTTSTADGCPFGGEHVHFPGGRYPHACLKCGRAISTNSPA